MEPVEGPLPWHVDPETLNEIVDDQVGLDALIDRLRAQLQQPEDVTAELLALGDLADALRVAGQTDEALELAERAVSRAETAGTGAQQHLARLRLVTARSAVGQDSDAQTPALVAAAGEYGPVIAALTHQTLGRYALDRDEFDEAVGHFRIALQLREGLELTDDATESRQALDRAGRLAAEETRSTQQRQSQQ